MDDITQKIQSLLNDEESMRQIQELAAMFSGGNGVDMQKDGNDEAADGGINPMAVMQVIGNMSVQDKNCELLMALRAHLSPEKQQKIDKAVKLMKMYNIFAAMRENGMLNDLEKML